MSARRDQLARGRALTKLSRLHPADYWQLYQAELAAIPDPRLDGVTPDQAEHRRTALDATS